MEILSFLLDDNFSEIYEDIIFRIYLQADSDENIEGPEETFSSEHYPELNIMDPQVILFYKNTFPRTFDLEEYYAINITPGITR